MTGIDLQCSVLCCRFRPFRHLYGRFDDNLCRTPEVLEGSSTGSIANGMWCFAGKDYLISECAAPPVRPLCYLLPPSSALSPKTINSRTSLPLMRPGSEILFSLRAPPLTTGSHLCTLRKDADASVCLCCCFVLPAC